MSFGMVLLGIFSSKLKSEKTYKIWGWHQVGRGKSKLEGRIKIQNYKFGSWLITVLKQINFKIKNKSENHCIKEEDTNTIKWAITQRQSIYEKDQDVIKCQKFIVNQKSKAMPKTTKFSGTF